MIVGLGNPGSEYENTPHNLGFMVIDRLAESNAIRVSRKEKMSLVGLGAVKEKSVALAKPQTFMNLSGPAVKGLLEKYELQPGRLVVVYDELDLPFGTIRLKLGGGDNGHNGLRSITSALRTRDYYRLRVGIGRPPGRMDPADYVLHDFAATERAELPEVIGRSADAIEALMTKGLAEAQNQFH